MGEASLAATMEAASLCLAMATSKSTRVAFPSQAGATTAAPNGDTYAARQETASCPPTRNFAPPQPCRGDSFCNGIDKCCFDTCLREHVCKAPIELTAGG